MKTTSLIRTKKNAVKLTAKPNPLSNDPDNLEAKLDKLLQVIQMQMEYNFEIMKRLNNAQQHSAQQAIIAQPVNEPGKTIVKTLTGLPALNNPEAVIPPLSYEKLKTLTRYFMVCIVNPPRKTETVHAMINVLHLMYHIGDEIFVEQLFACENLVTVTGYRYLHRLRKEGLIDRSGKYLGCAYKLTPVGRKFVEGEIKNKELLNEALSAQENR